MGNDNLFFNIAVTITVGAAAVVLWNRESPGDDQDDPYRDYQVPDDLMW